MLLLSTNSGAEQAYSGAPRLRRTPEAHPPPCWGALTDAGLDIADVIRHRADASHRCGSVAPGAAADARPGCDEWTTCLPRVTDGEASRFPSARTDASRWVGVVRAPQRSQDPSGSPPAATNVESNRSPGQPRSLATVVRSAGSRPCLPRHVTVAPGMSLSPRHVTWPRAGSVRRVLRAALHGVSSDRPARSRSCLGPS
jgi:hypothetical protein